MILRFIILWAFAILCVVGWLYIFHPPFHAWARKVLGMCDHRWLDTTVPFSDLKGGWHECQRCHKKRYIKWGFDWQREKELGHIASDPTQENKLMDLYTGFGKYRS